jgi:hypothetical protein
LHTAAWLGGATAKDRRGHVEVALPVRAQAAADAGARKLNDKSSPQQVAR